MPESLHSYKHLTLTSIGVLETLIIFIDTNIFPLHEVKNDALLPL